jgi:hypothetical protein
MSAGTVTTLTDFSLPLQQCGGSEFLATDPEVPGSIHGQYRKK